MDTVAFAKPETGTPLTRAGAATLVDPRKHNHTIKVASHPVKRNVILSLVQNIYYLRP